MKKVVWKWTMDYEKEETWLNEMSAKGFAFVRVSLLGRYTFTESAPGEYVYRMEYLKRGVHHPESQQYLRFMAETGAECVFSQSRYVYFRKRAEKGKFEIYSDIESRMAHYKRIGSVFLLFGILEVCIGIFHLLIFLTEDGFFSDLFLFGYFCMFSALFLHFWNRLRKKIKNLEKERGAWA